MLAVVWGLSIRAIESFQLVTDCKALEAIYGPKSKPLARVENGCCASCLSSTPCDMYHQVRILQTMVAHNCHGKTKNLTAKTKYLTAKPKTPRQKQNTSRQNQKPHGKNKNLTAKPNTSQQKQNSFGFAKGIWFCHEVFGFCCEVFSFAVRSLVLP